ncbi:MAG: hypothetical protein P8Y71_11170 [Pseudolabrys sp.]|jgi:hypothetical protein
MSKKLAQALKNCPPYIRPHMTKRNIISGEDAEMYDELFVDLAESFRPKSGLQWLDVKKLQDEIWQGLRLSSFKSRIIDSAQKDAIFTLLLSTMGDRVRDFTPGGNCTVAEQGAVDWFTNPAAKKQLQKLLRKFNYSQETINAHAFLARIEPLTVIDKMQTHCDARQFASRRLLEEQRGTLELEDEATDKVVARLEKKDTAAQDEEDVATDLEGEDEAIRAESQADEAQVVEHEEEDADEGDEVADGANGEAAPEEDNEDQVAEEDEGGAEDGAADEDDATEKIGEHEEQDADEHVTTQPDLDNEEDDSAKEGDDAEEDEEEVT